MDSLTLVNVSERFSKGAMPLGLLSIAGYLRKYGNDCEIKYLDANTDDIYAAFEPTDVVGISAVTQDMGNAERFAAFVRERAPHAKIVLGGVHITTYPVLPEVFDVGVIAEGEQTMVELMALDAFTPEAFETVDGLCWNQDGELRRSKPREIIMPMDTIPMPARDLANLDYYLTPRQIIPYHHGRSLTLLTSRGCPFTCAFCSTKIHWNRYRTFSVDRTIEEIELLVDGYGAEIVHIFDDLFIVNRKRLKAISERIVEKRLNERVKFMCLVRSDLLDDEVMQMLKAMNVVVTGIGMESGSPEILSYLKTRTVTLDENARAIALSDKYEIPTMGSFIVGNPKETEESLLDTLKFVQKYRYSPFLAPLSYIATAFPATEFWTYGKEKGINVEDYDNIVMDIPDSPEPLRTAPLLTDIPVDRFWSIAHQFRKETEYQQVKMHLFMAPEGAKSLYRAYQAGARIEGSRRQGAKEVTKILAAFCKIKVKNFLRRRGLDRGLFADSGVEDSATTPHQSKRQGAMPPEPPRKEGVVSSPITGPTLAPPPAKKKGSDLLPILSS